ncbi:molybdopterin-guanine dinucleotide biosynthesis protein B [Paracidovorax wautersii]|uniref:Molybdopterin guanine dinucleotide biosynthesis accessory protein MobB n=1 Tax=Paracidovorax wautersii TaxID=1177982 RepID=A0A1I2CNY3_9BURK|nr:molybdopterin-guanine dinucleotide biosynthesis protein B [Paracidovorax wautersii]SFE70021.1 molybdopterin guanine dinucleotide biosynthesis accessory protein MobB [Paracidovorax wautersii]
MKVVGFAGFSGCGKTTLVEQLIPELRLQGLRVSVVKHAHHNFDIDHVGKDTWRHREAGAYEVAVASDRRLAVMREFESPGALSVHALLAELDAGVDWVLVEGFKESDLPKVEVWRMPSPDYRERPARYPEDPHIVAIATDAAPAGLPAPTTLPVFDVRDPHALANWLLVQGGRFDYARPVAPASAAAVPPHPAGAL